MAAFDTAWIRDLSHNNEGSGKRPLREVNSKKRAL